MDFSSLDVRAVILHKVPKRNTEDPFYSAIESPLSRKLQNYIAQRMTESLNSKGHYEVIFNEETASPVPRTITEQLSDSVLGPNFVERSQRIAKHLYDIQNSTNSSGLVCVVACTIDQHPAVAILKLENERGINTYVDTVDGKETLKIEPVDNLTLTDTTKVYKAGLFVLEGPNDGTVNARVSDPQSGGTTLSEVSQFFLMTFLGCQLAKEPAVATKRFFDSAEKFINQFVSEPKLKAKYHMALLNEMQSNHTHIRPRTFAEEHLRVDDQKPFENFMRGKLAFSQVEKDTSFIEKRLGKVVYTFEEGAMLIASPSIIGRTIRIEANEDGEPICVVLDRLTRLGGSGGRKPKPKVQGKRAKGGKKQRSAK